jgi:hypothetical protein
MWSSKVSGAALAIAIVVVMAPTPGARAAPAPTAELAKKCREMMIKAHPSSQAGSKTGTSQQQRDYLKTCIARNGNMDKQ